MKASDKWHTLQMRAHVVGLSLCFGLALAPSYEAARAGYSWWNLSKIEIIYADTDLREFHLNAHLEQNQINSTSPPLTDDEWQVLETAGNADELDDAFALTSAADWWTHRTELEKRYFATFLISTAP